MFRAHAFILGPGTQLCSINVPHLPEPPCLIVYHITADYLHAQGEPELTTAQRGALMAAAAELQLQAAALSGSLNPAKGAGGPEAATAAAGLSEAKLDKTTSETATKQTSAFCNHCGVAGCCVSCVDGLRFLAAPPLGRCAPRGASYFYGCGLGFSPIRGAAAALKTDLGSMVRFGVAGAGDQGVDAWCWLAG